MFTLPLNFWLENLHFVIFVFAALAFFAAGWLNFDSSQNDTEKKTLVRAIGFFIIAFWLLVSASDFSIGQYDWIISSIELLGVVVLGLGFFMEPIPVLPDAVKKSEEKETSKKKTVKKKKQKEETMKKKLSSFVIFSVPNFSKLPVIGWLVVLVRVWLFSTKGLMSDLKGLRNALIFVFLSRAFSIASLFSDSSNMIIFDLSRQYSYLWVAENVFLFIGAIILLKWAFYFLNFRPTPKIFITFITTSILIFVVSTVIFTNFLYSAEQKNIVTTLEKNAATFDFSLAELKKQNTLAAYSLAQREILVSGVVENDAEGIESGLGDPIGDLQVGGSAVVNRSGEALVSTGPYVSVGESFLNDPTVSQALQGKVTSSFVIENLVDTDQLVIRSAYPIIKDGKVFGSTIVDFPIDQTFVDNIKELTKLDVTINVDGVHNATTFVDQNERRISGTLISNAEILALVNDNQKSPWTWSGAERIDSQVFLTVYRSLNDSDNMNIASLMVAQPQQEVIDGIDESIKLTFGSISLLIMVSLVPLYYVAKSVSKSDSD